MEQIETLLKINLLRREFIRWLMKVVSAFAVFTLWGNGVFRKSKANAAQSTQQIGASATEGQVTLQNVSASRTLLKNGLIVDGTGSKAFNGSLLINHHKIEKVITHRRTEGRGRRTTFYRKAR